MNDRTDPTTGTGDGWSSHSILALHDRLVGVAESIEPLPAAVVELAGVLADPEVGVREVADILRRDPVLVASVLREANSAASAPVQPIVEVDAAVARLGLGRVLAAACGGALGTWIHEPLAAYQQESGIWTHAVASSYVAEAIQRLSNGRVGPEVVTCALLHHLGQIVLDKLLDPSVFWLVALGASSVVAAERELLDADHAELGALLLELWELPDALIEPVRYHHDPLAVEGTKAAAVSLASTLAYELLAQDAQVSDDLAAALADPAIQSTLGTGSDSWSDHGHPGGSEGPSLDGVMARLDLDLDEVRARSTALLTAAGLIGDDSDV